MIQVCPALRDPGYGTFSAKDPRKLELLGHCRQIMLSMLSYFLKVNKRKSKFIIIT